VSREWKPGDVATRNGLRFMFCQSTAGREFWVDNEGDDRGISPLGIPVGRPLRPLVVLDPELDEDVQRLCDAYKSVDHSVGTYWMQAALRSLVAPPKPEEPQGLGAVIEDAEGTLWVYTGEEYAWASNGGARHWHELDVARVLSDGWTPDAPGGASS
jgi:hypothetical protein